jgi:hypothetical protein
MTRARIIAWEAGGALFTILAGSALHFAFAWSGEWRPVALIAAVNESVWEHLKLAFWPALLWALVEMRVLGAEPGRFWAAKSLGLLVAPLVIVAVFYGYTAILEDNLLILDIGTFVLAVIAGHAVSAWLLARPAPRRSSLRRAAHLLLAAQVLAYASFTYFPPRLGLFEETRSGVYGIPGE